MLVLSRLPGEAILVGDVEFRITRVRGDRVTIGITAPKHIPVYREEVYEAMKEAGTLPGKGAKGGN